MIEFNDGKLHFYFETGYLVSINLGRLKIEGLFNNGKVFTFTVDPGVLESQNHDEKIKAYFAQGENASGLSWQIELNIGQQDFNARWRINLQNTSKFPVFIKNIFLMDQAAVSGPAFSFNNSLVNNNLGFYSNGWQSWSTTGFYRFGDRKRRTRLGFLHEPMIVNPETPVFGEKNRFSSDFFSLILDRSEQCGFVLGFLSQREHFGSITADFRESPVLCMWANGDSTRLDPGKSITTDWAVIYPFQVGDRDPFEKYLKDVALEHRIGNLQEPPVGWCSWYYYYQNISQLVIEENLDKIKKSQKLLPFDLVQIDDGFQSQVGDWLSFRDGFPNGVKPLSVEIQQEDYKPGLWLAPFILHPRAKTVRDHPDWLLRRDNGSLVRTGFVWNSLGAALDLTNPGAMGYVREVIQTAVGAWGFPYLKLDFLYAAALKGEFQDKTKTRAQVLRSGMEVIRQSAGPEAFLVGCGAPLGSMLGFVDSMRIGPDVNKTWNPSFAGISLPFRTEPSMPSARNSIHNVLTRSPLHDRWWVNDPDCLLVRSDSKLSLPEIQSLATAIAMTGGPLLVSDDMTQLPEDRLRIIASLIPLMGLRADVVDLLNADRPSKLRLDLENAAGGWSLLACFNWNDQPQQVLLNPEDFKINKEDYLVRSFWDNSVWRTKSDGVLYSGTIPAHGVILLALRKLEDVPAIYLGGDLHVSQGLEVSSWSCVKDHLEFDIESGKQMAGFVDLRLNFQPAYLSVNSQEAHFEELNENIFRIQIPEVKSAAVKVVA